MKYCSWPAPRFLPCDPIQGMQRELDLGLIINIFIGWEMSMSSSLSSAVSDASAPAPQQPQPQQQQHVQHMYLPIFQRMAMQPFEVESARERDHKIF